MPENLPYLAIPPLLIAVILRRTERRVVRRLRSAQAFSPESAIELPRFNALGRWQLSRLQSAGAVVSAEPHGFYFVEEGYSAFRRGRRKRAAAVFSILAAIVVVVLLMR
jgi:hypothetical protein